MHTSVVTQDNISQLFRSIAQKRRQGVLNITLGMTQYHVCFVKGRIVEVVQDGESPLSEIVGSFKKAGYLGSQENFEANSYRELLDAILQTSPNSHLFDEELMKRVITHRLLQKLCSMEINNGGYSSFSVEMVDCDRELSPSISVGQLLLDMVAYQDEVPQYKAAIDDDQSYVAVEFAEDLLSEEELLLFRVLAQPASVTELQKRALLSSLSFYENLSGLIERGAVEPVEQPEPIEQIDNSPLAEGDTDLSGLDDIVALLGSSSDEEMEVSEILSDATAVQAEDGEGGEPDSAEVKSELGEAVTSKSSPDVAHTLTNSTADADNAGDSEDSPGVLTYYNSRMLQSNLVPNTSIALVWIGLLTIPFFFWQHIFQIFG